MKSRIGWFCHLRSIYYLRLNRMSTHKMQCEFAQHLEKGTNSKRIKYFGRSENLIAESPRRRPIDVGVLRGMLGLDTLQKRGRKIWVMRRGFWVW